jgi:mannose-6-phosphate isomerase-like protein (cupin superfamily)
MRFAHHIHDEDSLDSWRCGRDHRPMKTPEQLTIGANVVRILVPSDDTDGRLAVIEYDVPAGFPGPPLHIHPAFDEHFYVIGGQLEFRVDDETVLAGPGASLYACGDQPHTFSNPTGEVARMLVTVTPGGFEQFFRDLAAAANGGFPDPQVAARINSEHSVELLMSA